MTWDVFKVVLGICSGVAVMLLVLACSCGKPKEGLGPESRPVQPDTTVSDTGITPAPQVIPSPHPYPSGGPYPPGPVVVPTPTPAPALAPVPAPSVSARPLPHPARPEACWLLRITDGGETISHTRVACPRTRLQP